jgi:hypothetical protein
LLDGFAFCPWTACRKSHYSNNSHRQQRDSPSSRRLSYRTNQRLQQQHCSLASLADAPSLFIGHEPPLQQHETLQHEAASDCFF